MSVVPLKAGRSGTKLRIGFLRLTDSAPAIVAQEFGWFADQGLDVELHREPSWANIADKLAYGFLDAAVIVPPLAFAIELGLRGISQPLILAHNRAREHGAFRPFLPARIADLQFAADAEILGGDEDLGVAIDGEADEH